jgi:hypothetical protein
LKVAQRYQVTRYSDRDSESYATEPCASAHDRFPA